MHEILYMILYVWEVLFCFMLQVYMYSVWYGYLLSLILFTMIWKLFMNYLHAKWVSLTKYIFSISIYFVFKYYIYIVMKSVLFLPINFPENCVMNWIWCFAIFAVFPPILLYWPVNGYIFRGIARYLGFTDELKEEVYF